GAKSFASIGTGETPVAPNPNNAQSRQETKKPLPGNGDPGRGLYQFNLVVCWPTIRMDRISQRPLICWLIFHLVGRRDLAIACPTLRRTNSLRTVCTLCLTMSP